MQFKLKNTKITISFTFFALIILLICFNKTEYLFISLFSAILHELGHLFTLNFFDAKILEFKISLFGGKIETDNFIPTNYFQDVLIYFSGPFVNLIFSIFFFFLNFILQDPKIVDIISVNAVLAIFNLLPFYNFDGGKIIEALLKIKLVEKQAEVILTIVSILVLIPFIYFSFNVFLQNKNNLYFIIVSLLMLLTIILKK